VQSPHSWAKYWEILNHKRDIFGPQKFGAHIIVGMGETEFNVLELVQKLVDMGGHSHMFCFFPEKGSLMDHLARSVAPRAAWPLSDRLLRREGRADALRRSRPGRRFRPAGGRTGRHHRCRDRLPHLGFPGKFQDDISACDRPYGASPPSNIASFPFQPNKRDIGKIRRQLGETAKVQ
jgi:biotin synthase